jgi:competence protein ComEC
MAAERGLAADGAGRSAAPAPPSASRPSASRPSASGPPAARLRALAAPLAAGQGRRLALWAPVLLGLGVQCWFLAPADPPPWSGGAAALAAFALWLAARRRAPVLACAAAALLCVALGLAAASFRAAAVAAPVLAAPVTALVEGRVREVDQSASGRIRLTLDRPAIWGLPPAETPVRLRVALVEGAAPVPPGAWVSVIAALSAPAGPAEPGGFDFARAAWFDRLGAVGVARGGVALVDGPPPGGPFDRAALFLDAARFALSERLRAALPGETGAFAAALATGGRRGLPVDALDALRVSGLAHLLSISGLHMAVVCGLLFWTARLALVLVPGLALRAPVKKFAALVGLAGGAAYLALSGAATPTERAFVMAAVALGAVLVDRPAVTLRAVALAAALILLRAPESLLDAGFQMSFAATVALVAAYEAARGVTRPGPGLGRAALLWLCGLVGSSLVAGLATAPFAAFHFQRASSWSLLANLLGVPAMSVVTAPALALAAAAAPFGLSAWPLTVAGWSIDWVLGVARWTAALPGAEAALAAAHPAALWCVTFGGLWLCLWRGPLRLGGLAPLALAGALWSAADRPAILIGADGSMAGVLGPQGRALAGVGRETFVAESWLRRDGDLADRAAAEARPAFARSGPWLEARADGLTVLVPRAPDAGRPPGPADIARRCQPGVVIVLPAGASDPLSGATNRRSRSGAELRPGEGAATRAPAHKPTTPAPVSAASARPPASAPAPGLACIVLSAADLAARGPAAIHAAPAGPRLAFARDASARRPWGRARPAAQ